MLQLNRTFITLSSSKERVEVYLGNIYINGWPCKLYLQLTKAGANVPVGLDDVNHLTSEFEYWKQDLSAPATRAHTHCAYDRGSVGP